MHTQIAFRRWPKGPGMFRLDREALRVRLGCLLIVVWWRETPSQRILRRGK